MVPSHTERFVDSARTAGATVTQARVADFGDCLCDLVDAPAIGTPLPFDGVSYDATPVDTEPTGADLKTAATGVTAGRLGIADYGSVVLQESGAGEELLGLYPDRHVVVVAGSDVVSDMPAAYERLDEQFDAGADDAIIATGPSATADMGAVVTGVHGPRDVHVLVLTDR